MYEYRVRQTSLLVALHNWIIKSLRECQYKRGKGGGRDIHWNRIPRNWHWLPDSNRNSNNYNNNNNTLSEGNCFLILLLLPFDQQLAANRLAKGFYCFDPLLRIFAQTFTPSTVPLSDCLTVYLSDWLSVDCNRKQFILATLLTAFWKRPTSWAICAAALDKRSFMKSLPYNLVSSELNVNRFNALATSSVALKWIQHRQRSCCGEFIKWLPLLTFHFHSLETHFQRSNTCDCWCVLSGGNCKHFYHLLLLEFH